MIILKECIKRETEKPAIKYPKYKRYLKPICPGSVTEILHFFIAEYSNEMKINDGGGLEEEGENIEV
jgi:hypothetical protein